MADEIANQPQYARALRAITNPSATPSQIAAAMQGFEGSQDVAGDTATNLRNAMQIAAIRNSLGPMPATQLA